MINDLFQTFVLATYEFHVELLYELAFLHIQARFMFCVGACGRVDTALDSRSEGLEFNSQY